MYCILIAGMPATGKTSFANWISKKRNLPFMSKDTIKEIMFDHIGFKSRAEKVALGDAAMDILYYFAEQQMIAEGPFIIENNFEDCSREGIRKLLSQYNYTPITILFDGDMEAIYKRFIERDQSPERHRGHVINTEYPEKGEKAPYVPMKLEYFAEVMEKRGFRRFNIGGEIIKVDCTDIDKIDYEDLNDKLSNIISNKI
jgi:predicted kinase